VITPRAREERAGNNCFATRNAEAVAGGLRDRGVQVVGKDGRVRISPHLFNDESDVQRCVEALYALRREGIV
jgi:selenocysteine lyase/cysteine desulfurase